MQKTAICRAGSLWPLKHYVLIRLYRPLDYLTCGPQSEKDVMYL
jgi:hypothetical protein